MTDEMIALARRAVACKGWRCMPGMLTDEGRRVMQVWPDNLGIKWSHLLDNRVVRDADGVDDERAAVVAWLRAQAYLTLYDDKPDDIADCIERGEHRREEDV